MEHVNRTNARQRSSSRVTHGLLCQQGKWGGQKSEKSKGSFERSLCGATSGSALAGARGCAYDDQRRHQANRLRVHWISPFWPSEGPRIGCAPWIAEGSAASQASMSGICSALVACMTMPAPRQRAVASGRINGQLAVPRVLATRLNVLTSFFSEA